MNTVKINIHTLNKAAGLLEGLRSHLLDTGCKGDMIKNINEIIAEINIAVFQKEIK